MITVFSNREFQGKIWQRDKRVWARRLGREPPESASEGVQKRLGMGNRREPDHNADMAKRYCTDDNTVRVKHSWRESSTATVGGSKMTNLANPVGAVSSRADRIDDLCIFYKKKKWMRPRRNTLESLQTDDFRRKIDGNNNNSNNIAHPQKWFCCKVFEGRHKR